MTQTIFKKKHTTVPKCYRNDIFEFVESIKKHIYENNCAKLSFNISNLNIIDASKVIVLCSAFHYAKYPHGEISWTTNSAEIGNLIKPLNLGNVKLINSR